jgi:CheY-like chemotaxis protein
MFEDESTGDRPGGTEPHAGSSRQNQTRPRILLADDNAQTRDYLSRLLKMRYEVDTVVDGAAALAAARQNPPDLVLTDATMPRLDGLELVRQLRLVPETAAIPVILLSARIGGGSRAEALSAGANEYLEKPFTAVQVLACIRRLLRQ